MPPIFGSSSFFSSCVSYLFIVACLFCFPLPSSSPFLTLLLILLLLYRRCILLVLLLFFLPYLYVSLISIISWLFLRFSPCPSFSLLFNVLVQVLLLQCPLLLLFHIARFLPLFLLFLHSFLSCLSPHLSSSSFFSPYVLFLLFVHLLSIHYRLASLLSSSSLLVIPNPSHFVAALHP